ncbi:MAG: long-chain fatty acid--CoA ligase [Azoarcus sp. PHD]|nr:MAG: long-chain fatty acid--CoA ligase [Azoarcus sp. PHD]
MLDCALTAALPQRIHEACMPWVAKRPEGRALEDAMHTICYGELPGLLSAVAAVLTGMGVRPGDRVLLVGENSVALAVSILALSSLDAWSATVNPRLSSREINNFVSHSGARRVLYFGATSTSAAAHGAAANAAAVSFPTIGEVLVGPLAEPEPETVFESGAEQVAALVYTSGTTGAPKAVMLTHRNLAFIGANSRSLRRVVPEDVVYGVLPLSHVYGLSALLIASLISGACLRLVPLFTPDALAVALEKEGVTVLHGVPAMYARLLDWCRRNGKPLAVPTLRVAQSGGSPLTLPLKQAFEAASGLVLNNGYGMTEAAPSICQTRMDAPRTDCSVGQGIPGIELKLNEPEGEAFVGELWVRGPNVMKGYFHAPELSTQVLTPDGWLRTGDLARIDEDGAVHIVGRAKELIIRSGFNVYPVEVEQVLNAHPDVVQSAVVGRQVDGNEEVIAFVEAVSGRTLDLDDLARHLRANLSPYKVPAHIRVLEHLPAAATGKILKTELRHIAEGLGKAASV